MANIFKEFFGANRITLIKDGEKTIIACDAVISESHQMNSEATQYEIEDGSDISDHVINRGKLLTIEGVISDDPITILQTDSLPNILDRAIATVTPNILRSKLSYGLSGDNGKPSKEAFDQLEKIYDNKIPVIIITGLKKYDNMIMEDLTIPRSSRTIRSLSFTATFRQIKIVSTQFVTSPNVYQDVELGAQSKTNIGKQSSSTLLKDTDKGFAKTLKDWFFNLF
jgi:hypothetical protein